jgi:hypothetical protein
MRGSTARGRHVDPEGPNQIDNAVLACWSCNAKKGHRTPEEAGMQLLPCPLIVPRDAVGDTTGQSRDVPPLPYRTVPTEPQETTATSDPNVEPLCELLAGLVEANGSKRPTITTRWRRECHLLLTRDERPAAEVEALIRWSQASEFWRPNVMSMVKFRAKYDTLRLQRDRENVVAVPDGAWAREL